MGMGLVAALRAHDGGEQISEMLCRDQCKPTGTRTELKKVSHLAFWHDFVS